MTGLRGKRLSARRVSQLATRLREGMTKQEVEEQSWGKCSGVPVREEHETYRCKKCERVDTPFADIKDFEGFWMCKRCWEALEPWERVGWDSRIEV